MEKAADKTTEWLWDEVLGKHYSQGQHESLVRALAWANNAAWPLASFVEIVKRQQKMIEELSSQVDYLKDLVEDGEPTVVICQMTGIKHRV